MKVRTGGSSKCRPREHSANLYCITCLGYSLTQINVRMRAALVTSIAAYAAILHVSNAFTHSATPLAVRSGTYAKRFPGALFVHQEQFMRELEPKTTTTTTSSAISALRQRLRCVGTQAWERMDTMKAAGLCDNRMTPLQSGFKMNVGLLIGAFLFKWYRARFINKVCVKTDG